MHRRYRPWHYAEKVDALVRAAGPELTLGADVMVGFPGETDGEFEETLELVRALPFGYLHLFPFSPRPGTRGWALHAEAAGSGCGGRRANGCTARFGGRKKLDPPQAFCGPRVGGNHLAHAGGIGRAEQDGCADGEFLTGGD